MAPSSQVLVPTAVGGKTVSQATSQTIHVLNLNDDGSPDIIGSYINLPPPLETYTLRFAIVGGAKVCREGTLYVNIPKKGEEFDRKKFQKFE
jgi:glycogen debranching enzyme